MALDTQDKATKHGNQPSGWDYHVYILFLALKDGRNALAQWQLWNQKPFLQKMGSGSRLNLQLKCLLVAGHGQALSCTSSSISKTLLVSESDHNFGSSDVYDTIIWDESMKVAPTSKYKEKIMW